MSYHQLSCKIFSLVGATNPQTLSKKIFTANLAPVKIGGEGCGTIPQQRGSRKQKSSTQGVGASSRHSYPLLLRHPLTSVLVVLRRIIPCCIVISLGHV